MIISKLYGGLGNQLFQYAIARRIAYLHQAPLRLDISSFKQDRLREYKLDNFNIRAGVATSQELAFFLDVTARGFATRLINRYKPYYKKYFIQERGYEFDAKVLNAPSHVYLDGYWQSDRYFVDIEGILRQELTLKQKPDGLNQQMLQTIRSVNAVCLHVRRGDYITNPHTHKIHGVCSLAYYEKAVALLSGLVPEPHFFVFTDDSEWVQKKLIFDFPLTFVLHNGPDKDYADLNLMAACNHFIIANSSFSWWGAWLGENKAKIVIAPKKWGNDPAINTIHRLPRNWLTV